MNCRHCKTPLAHTFLDLSHAPPSNFYLSKDDLNKQEIYYPLKVFVCDQCWLVQTKDYIDPKILFNPKYAYFSSVSISWLKHAKEYTDKIIKELNLNNKSYVIEIASNDGYLLKNFLSAGIPCLGIEPTNSTSDLAKKKGIPVLCKFFSKKLAQKIVSKGKRADLIIGNNVFAHVKNINDFTKGLKKILKPDGTINLEFPHLMSLIKYVQFDTVYHEHFSYLSLQTVIKIFEKANLRIFDVEKLSTHGGSLRIYGCHTKDTRKTKKSVSLLINEEKKIGLNKLKIYKEFQERVDKQKIKLIKFLIEQKINRKIVFGFGAAAKANTLINYCGIKSELIPFIIDNSKAKIGHFMPGSHIPIVNLDCALQKKHDYILIFAWNIADEIMKIEKLKKLKTKYLIVTPDIKIIRH